MSLFATNRRTKKKFPRRRRKRNSDRVKESEKLGSGYFKNESVL